MFVLPPGPPIRVGSEINVHGLHCVVETPKYDVRIGKTWMNSSPAHYGFIKGYIGADGDEIDCYIGSDQNSPIVGIIDQNRMGDSGYFDEHKIMLCYNSRVDALRDYRDGHTSSHKVFRAVTWLTVPQFKRWLKLGDLSQPISDQIYNHLNWRKQ